MAKPIKKFLETIVSIEKNWKTGLLYNWNTIIGSLHNKVHIEKIYDDTIVLSVIHSSLMQELYLLSPLLINTINQNLDQPRIKQVRFKQASIKKNKQVKEKIIDNTTQPKKITLSQRDERVLAKITDLGLREILRSYRIRCYQEK